MDAVGWWLLAAWLGAGGLWYGILRAKGLFRPRSRSLALRFAWAVTGGVVMWLGFALSSLRRRR